MTGATQNGALTTGLSRIASWYTRAILHGRVFSFQGGIVHSVHVCTCVAKLLCALSMATSHLVYPFVHGNGSCFHLQRIFSDAAVYLSIQKQVWLLLSNSWAVNKTRLLGLTCNFLGHHTLLVRCIVLQPGWQKARAAASLCPQRHSFFSVIWVVATLAAALLKQELSPTA